MLKKSDNPEYKGMKKYLLVFMQNFGHKYNLKLHPNWAQFAQNKFSSTGYLLCKKNLYVSCQENQFSLGAKNALKIRQEFLVQFK